MIPESMHAVSPTVSPLGFKKPSTDGSKWKELALNENSLASDNHRVLVPL